MKQESEAGKDHHKGEFRPKKVKSPGVEARSFSIRLTEEERAVLRERAGRLPLAAHIRGLILAEEDQTRRRRRAADPVQDQEALARVLAMLGQSRLSSHLRQLAEAVAIGALPVTPETEVEIAKACASVAAMRRYLMRALGVGEDKR